MLLVAVVITPDKCFPLGLVLCIFVDDVESEVKVLGDLDLEVLNKILVTVEVNSLNKSFQ